MSIRLLIVDDHTLIRRGVAQLLAAMPDFEVAGEAADGEEAVAFCRDHRVDVVVMDLQMPRMTGMDAAAQITETHPEVAVVAVSAYAGGITADQLERSGVRGVVCKTGAFEELAGAIRDVYAGKSYFSRPQPSTQLPPLDDLTHRELEVLKLLAEGHTTKSAAFQLHVSPKTVETHRRNLMQKLDIDNLAGLTKYALRTGLIALEPPFDPSTSPYVSAH